MKSRLPLGIQTFRKVREGGYRYVDKTPWARRMAEGESGYYFLSRPRRFGKSLFLDMLGELFEGSEKLFRGLAIHSDWDWKKRHPVVRLSFGSGNFKDPDRAAGTAIKQLVSAERRAGVTPAFTDPSDRLADLLEVLHKKTGHRVVVLVDEYDKPILDALETPKVAVANREFLRGLYGTIKDYDRHVRFVFLTGVSRFSKVNLFSGLNNLEDISLDPRYSAVCGYTEADLDETFGEEMAGLDRDLVREWYNGYSWLGEEKVYNPYDVLLLLESRRFEAWWFKTGTPEFLVKMLIRQGIPSHALGGITVGGEVLDAFEVDDIEPEALLFQTGYLTIEGIEGDDDEALYRLGYPNREVRQSFNRNLLTHLTGRDRKRFGRMQRLRPLLEANDFDGLEALCKSFFSSLPYERYTNTTMARHEGFYASVVHGYFAGAGLDVHSEESVNEGRMDMRVRHAGQVYVFEFKMAGGARSGGAGADVALAQIEARGYANKFLDRGEPVHLIGMEFSAVERNLVGFEVKSV